jgi:hypothetical protein
MSGISAVSISNLRSLRNTGYIEFKPITILVGKNSSGKSTFLRTFPLLKQSTEEQKSESILWYGRRVDFGSFDESVNQNSNDNEIVFGFKIELDGGLLRRNSFRISSGPLMSVPRSITSDVTIKLKKSDRTGPQLTSVSLNAFNKECDIEFDHAGRMMKIRFGMYNFDYRDKNFMQSASFGSLIPETHCYKNIKSADQNRYIEIDPVMDEFHEKIKAIPHGKTERATINQIIGRLSVESLTTFKRSLTIASQLSTWKSRIEHTTLDENKTEELRDHAIATIIPAILREINREIARFYAANSYIEPLRATAERYYRKQALKIDEIDSRGENIALYIHSLSPYERKNLIEWMQENFGFHVDSTEKGGHIALSIFEPGKPTANMADSGFGFSQILPILILLWGKVYKRSSRMPIDPSTKKTLCIEQPELHLHPGYQSKLADLLAKYASASKESISLIIETHSKSLINRLGENISQGKISKDDIQILLFEKSESGESEVIKANYNDDGVLENWPFGFFEAD